jgi:hypothetical protein
LVSWFNAKPNLKLSSLMVKSFFVFVIGLICGRILVVVQPSMFDYDYVFEFRAELDPAHINAQNIAAFVRERRCFSVGVRFLRCKSYSNTDLDEINDLIMQASEQLRIETMLLYRSKIPPVVSSCERNNSCDSLKDPGVEINQKLNALSLPFWIHRTVSVKQATPSGIEVSVMMGALFGFLFFWCGFLKYLWLVEGRLTKDFMSEDE